MCGNKKTISKKLNLDLVKLPPCKNSLRPHIDRVAFQLRRLKLSNEKTPDIPNPSPDHGWIMTESGNLEPKWNEGDILPQHLVDVLASPRDDVAESDSEDEGEGDEEDAEGDESGPEDAWMDIESD